MSDLTLVVVGKDMEAIRRFDASHVEGVSLALLANTLGEPLSKIANNWLDNCDTPVFGLCHADVIFGAGALQEFAAAAMLGQLCGIVGRDLKGVYRCSYNRAAAEKSWWCEGVLTGGPGIVSTLNGMAVFMRRDLGELHAASGLPLRFDEETFDGFHCHVEDLCLQAAALGISVVVPSADAHHRNHKQTGSFLQDYRMYRARLEAKWKGTEFATT